MSVAHLDHQIEGEVEVIEEGFLSSNNPPLTEPVGPPLTKLPSTSNFDPFARYNLLPS